ncbi:tRNA (cytosine(38)-C(5))-methyltransferase [Trichinella pseudospiralis]
MLLLNQSHLTRQPDCFQSKRSNSSLALNSREAFGKASPIRNGKCRCRPGSIKKCGVCEPINYRCPFGQALSNFKGIIKCTINTITFKDDCPKRGVCCGKGNTNPRGNCLKGLVLKGYGNCRTYCPKETHFCTVFSTVVQELSPCCPRPCLNNTYYSGGRYKILNNSINYLTCTNSFNNS